MAQLPIAQVRIIVLYYSRYLQPTGEVPMAYHGGRTGGHGWLLSTNPCNYSGPAFDRWRSCRSRRFVVLYYTIQGLRLIGGAAADRAGSYYCIILFKVSPAYRRGTHGLPWGAHWRTWLLSTNPCIIITMIIILHYYNIYYDNTLEGERWSSCHKRSSADWLAKA